MLKTYTIILSLVLVILGLTGFYKPNVYNIIHLDLWLSFVYLIAGAIGLKLGLDKNTSPISRMRFVDITTATAFVLVLFGLTLPNFFDIFHLEMTENALHFAIGVIGSVISYKAKLV